MFKIARFDKQILHMIYAKIWLIILIVAFAILLTLFVALSLITVCGWGLLATAALCLLPWLIAIIVASTSLYLARRQYQEDKAEWFESSRNALIGRAVIMVAQYFLKKYSK